MRDWGRLVAWWVLGAQHMAGRTTFYWIGTGSAFNPFLGNTSFLVYGTANRVLLVDCGTTVGHRLIELGLIRRVTDVIITHTHADHIGSLETLAFYHHFVCKHHGAARPRLHVGSEAMAHDLWEHSLRGGMGKNQDTRSEAILSTLNTYFQVETGRTVRIPGLPDVFLEPTPHIAAMENYALRFDNGVYYSGDTTALPPHDPTLIFQDCQFHENGPGGVHVTYEGLKRNLPPEIRAKTHLVHLSEQYPRFHPEQDGFAGMVMPQQEFIV
jgi:glyoxylase-like metal-dependent hydrolase (beta-lactamase superfamily II)